MAQSRVRRLIGRRRAGLDRYIGVLSREMGQGSQDNADPIAELLTQLSGETINCPLCFAHRRIHSLLPRHNVIYILCCRGTMMYTRHNVIYILCC